VTLRQALTLGGQRLAALQDVENPSLESEILLRYAVSVSRAQLYLDLDRELNPGQEKLFRDWLERRRRGEPAAYIIGCREFFGLDLYVDSHVLIPRPETELLVEEALAFARNHNLKTLADIGAGSGAIAVSLAVNLPGVKIYATDISSEALEAAAINCRKHNVAGRVVLLQGDLLDPLPTPVDLLVANLPYVRKADFERIPSARFEPSLALDGGESGLDQLFRLCRQVKGRLNPGGCVLLEIGQGQGKAVSDLLRSLFPEASIEVKPDLAGIERMIRLSP
jgi:release factor glutamine methyltransferase